MRAVNHAYLVLSWQENLPRDEIPPEWMWPLDDDLEAWFEEVQAKRDEKYGRSDTVDGPGMMQNQLTKGRPRR
jgi:hypothetical protein